MLRVDNRRISQPWNFSLEVVDGCSEQSLEEGIIHHLLFVSEPTVTRNSFLDIEAIGLGIIWHRMKAQFQYQQRMFEQKAAQVSDIVEFLAFLDQQRFHIRLFWMGA